MKTLYSLSRDRADRFSGVTDALMGLLLLIALVQVALCAGAATQLAAPREASAANSHFLELQTNSVQAHGVGAALDEKS